MTFSILKDIVLNHNDSIGDASDNDKSAINSELDSMIVLSRLGDKYNNYNPVLVTKLLNILSDEKQETYKLSIPMTLKFYRLLVEYNKICREAFLEYADSNRRINIMTLMNYESNVIYYVQAMEGRRVATQNEVSNGVRELQPEFQHVLDDDARDYVNLLIWTFTGMIRYYTRSGLDVTYTNNKLDENDVQLVVKAGQKLRGMIDWMADDSRYGRAINALKSAKKKMKYIYPTYAADEIIPGTSFKQACYICSEAIKHGTASDTQKEARKLLYMQNSLKYKLLPHDMAVIRQAAHEIKNGIKANDKLILSEEVQNLIKDLELGAKSGILNPDKDFVFKIISTIKKNGRCSGKQLSILKEARSKLDSSILVIMEQRLAEKREQDAMAEGGIMHSILGMSQALGSGGFDFSMVEPLDNKAIIGEGIGLEKGIGLSGDFPDYMGYSLGQGNQSNGMPLPLENSFDSNGSDSERSMMDEEEAWDY